MSQKYKYLIRPDGSLRVVTQGEALPNDTDHLESLTPYYHPGRHFWDFGTSQMVAYTEEQLAQRQQDKADAQDAEDAAVQAKRDRLAELMPLLSAEQQEVVALVAELGGVSLE